MKLLILTAFILFASVAYSDPLPKFPSLMNNPEIVAKFQACNNDGDCTTNGCQCFSFTQGNYCADQSLYKSMVSSCSSCYDNACDYCVDTTDLIGYPICPDCDEIAATQAGNKCDAEQPEPPTPPKEEPEPPAPGPPTPRPAPTCVATAWIESNGHSEGILQNGGYGRVLCIPDFPCGTPGHVVRECNSDNKCLLKTYAQVCKTRGDCIESMEAVSQLKNNYDWSSVSRDACDLSGTLYLTSLSMNPDASKFSISSFLAHLVDNLNRIGLGSVSDVAVTVPSYGRAAMNYARSMISDSSSD